MRLIIAEKPSVAKELARIVGASRSERGYLSGPDVIVSWCVGHLVELAFPETYNPDLKKWRIEDLPILPEQYLTSVKASTSDQFETLRSLLLREDLDEVVCATDAGREGELIFRLVYDKVGCRKPVKRLWISSMEEKSIRDGLASMKDGSEYDRLYQAALCRQRADWLIGINFTRLYSIMYNRTLKAGRVQTPTVNLIVRRQREIDHFVPQVYYTLTAQLGSFRAYTRAETQSAAQELVARCGGKEAYVTQADRQEKREGAPALYDLTTLQREANRLFGYPAQKTLDVIQALYEAKLATYPRTDSRYITADMEQSTRALIGKLSSEGLYDLDTPIIPEALAVKAVINDKKVSDHHALLPTANVSLDRLSALPVEQKGLLLLLVYRLLAAVSPAHRYFASKVILDIDGVPFTATGREVIEEGHRRITERIKQALGVKKETEEAPDEPLSASLPPMGVGNVFSVHRVSSQEKKTQPPKAFTEDTLLAAMASAGHASALAPAGASENAGKELSDQELQEAMKGSGLGTPATRAGIIENIIRTGYIKREGRKLIPTEVAFTFMDLVSETIKSPELTAQWEKQLEEIEQGALSADGFMKEITDFLRQFVTGSKLLYSSENRCEIFKHPDREAIGICPRCGMQVVEYPKSFSCESGKDGCGFVIWKQIAGKAITPAMAKKLLSNGKTGQLKGFTSKAGKSFDAALAFKADYSVGFEFQSR